ncbi:MAG: transcription antitermination factor NusB [Lentimicrobiaceae bacterium]|jgi:N utilization substance protein B|nr:transcription antitermination factor NusB [Lentimicrobiaceae bacterium]
MLNRRYLRVKVLQALYAYYQSGNNQLDQGEKQLLLSINKLYELFIWQLSFLVELTRFAENRIEENKQKHLPTVEDLHPNMRFVKNRVLEALSNNKSFQRFENTYKINWSGETEMIRKYYNQIRETVEYQKYMSTEKDDFANDKKFLIHLIEKYFADFELLQFFYEEKSMYFVDDYHLISYLLIKFFKEMDENFDALALLPTLLKTENDEINEDQLFVKRLFRFTLLNDAEYASMIVSTTSNWEKDRIASVDLIILKMALTELLNFPSIPVKVTMNEYIDLSKYYSTHKSKIFVNGVLDKLIQQLRREDKIVKTGRGLIEKSP